MWIPPEDKDPVVLHAPTRKSVAFFGGVRIRDGRLVRHKADVFNAESFKAFLLKVLHSHRTRKKILLILDNAKYHHARALRPWLAKNRSRIQLLFLPPYSPELNPIERVWKLTRRLCTHNQYFAKLENLIATVDAQFQAWRKPNEILRKLCAI
jgi:transposase